MKSKNKVIEEINDSQDLYYVSIILLSLLTGSNTYSNIPELALLLDSESFMNLIDYYGGVSLKIPTKEEVSNSLKAVLVYYYADVLGYSMKDAIEKADAKNDLMSVNRRLPYIRNSINNFTIPKSLKNPKEDLIDD